MRCYRYPTFTFAFSTISFYFDFTKKLLLRFLNKDNGDENENHHYKNKTEERERKRKLFELYGFSNFMTFVVLAQFLKNKRAGKVKMH